MIVPGSPSALLLAQSRDPLDEFGVIARSLRLRASANGYLTRTPSIDGDRLKFTVSMWVKFGKLPSPYGYLFGAAADVSATSEFWLNSDGTLGYVRLSTGTSKWNRFLRDNAAHQHIVFHWDSANATANDRFRVYINGIHDTSFSTLSTANVNEASYMSTAGVSMDFGAYGYGHTYPLDCNMSAIAFVDGQNCDPSVFAQSHPRTDQWRPKEKAAIRIGVLAGGGTRNGWGTNGGFYPMDDNTSLTTLGYDRSQSDTDTTGNNLTVVNCSLTAGSTYDLSLDTPTDDYPVIDPLDVYKVGSRTLSDANLKLTCSLGGGRASIALPSTGVWVFEGGFTSAPSGNTGFGIGQADADISGNVIADNCVTYNCNGNKTTAGAYSAFAAAYTNANTIRIEANMVAKTVEFFKDGVSQGSLSFASLTGPIFFLYTNPASVSCIAWMNFGQRAFAGTPTAGALKLSTKNLAWDATVTVSGSFSGTLLADGPRVFMNGTPETLRINGNAVTFGVDADRLATGFKIRTASASYNNSGANTWTATILSPSIKSLFRFQNAKGN